jgi:ABC-type multidrug transport system ATPase subunit
MELVIKDLSKTYSNGVKALNNVNLNIPKCMFGLLGPNGAGKSSLMRTIATLQEADSGSITFNGINVFEDKEALRRTLGYLPQEFGLYPKISAELLLDHLASLKGINNPSERKETVNALLQKVNLWQHRKKNLGTFSGGMKQRFGIAQALLANPKLIIVDEPTAGLDPAERHRFLNVLREIGTNNTVIFSTHIVDDVKELCNEMAILNGGKILTQNTPKGAAESLMGKIWTKAITREELEQNENQFNVISSNYNDDNTLNIKVYSDEKPSESFVICQPQLEDVYFVALKSDQ